LNWSRPWKWKHGEIGRIVSKFRVGNWKRKKGKRWNWPCWIEIIIITEKGRIREKVWDSEMIKEDGSVFMNETKKGIKLKAFIYLEWETWRNKKKKKGFLFVGGGEHKRTSTPPITLLN